MGRWYQNALTGKQVEVHTLEQDDFYSENPSLWVRIAPPPDANLKAALPKSLVQPRKKV